MSPERRLASWAVRGPGCEIKSTIRTVKYPTTTRPMIPSAGIRADARSDQRRVSERRRDSDGSNRIRSGRDENRRKADNKRERAEDDVQNQVDIINPDPANRLGLHNHGWPIRDRRPDRRRNGHRTKGAPQSIKVSLKLKPTWEPAEYPSMQSRLDFYRSDPPRRARSACSTTSRAVGVTSNSPTSRISTNRASSASLPGSGSPWT